MLLLSATYKFRGQDQRPLEFENRPLGPAKIRARFRDSALFLFLNCVITVAPKVQRCSLA